MRTKIIFPVKILLEGRLDMLWLAKTLNACVIKTSGYAAVIFITSLIDRVRHVTIGCFVKLFHAHFINF
jgi:hypothetical protein